MRGRKKSQSKSKIKNASKVTYDGIDFRSKLESFMWKQLQDNNIEAEYEKHKYVLLKEFEWMGEKVREMTYTPDFVSPTFIIECKGYPNEVWPIKLKLFKKLMVDDVMPHALYIPRNQEQCKDVVKQILAIKALEELKLKATKK